MGCTLEEWIREPKPLTSFQLVGGPQVWEPGRRGQETGFLSLAFCSVGSEKKKKKNEAAKEAETPLAKKIKPQTPNTFPKRKKVGCLVFLSGASF